MGKSAGQVSGGARQRDTASAAAASRYLLHEAIGFVEGIDVRSLQPVGLCTRTPALLLRAVAALRGGLRGKEMKVPMTMR